MKVSDLVFLVLDGRSNCAMFSTRFPQRAAQVLWFQNYEAAQSVNLKLRQEPQGPSANETACQIMHSELTLVFFSGLQYQNDPRFKV